MTGAAPLTVALGAGAFALLAMAVVRRLVRDGKAARQQAAGQISGLRAMVDEYEALLSSSREVTVVWSEQAQAPKFLGQASVILPPGRRPEAVLDFAAWLAPSDADHLVEALTALKVEGRSFSISLKSRDGRLMRAAGWVLGGGTVLRIRPAFEQPGTKPLITSVGAGTDLTTTRAVLAALSEPAFMRDTDRRLIYANPAYLALAKTLGKKGAEGTPPEIIDGPTLQRHFAQVMQGNGPQTLSVTLPEADNFELVEFKIGAGMAGYLRSQIEAAAPASDAGLAEIAAIIGTLSTPVAIFDRKHELVEANRAYAALWKFDPAWLRPGLDERTILDRLRTEGMLPSEADYHAWRTQHLTSYGLTAKRENEPWHLPDGRTLNVTAAPAGPEGGVIYVFEDITPQLELLSQNKALVSVQRSTLNALSEGVAVFHTSGRLKLWNPRFSTLWKLPMNQLEQYPHIDEIAAAASRAMPEDGAAIWRDLKRGIIDLNPTRPDQSGRLTRADGKLIDYAIVRMPDGQKMMTFLDVTESANFQRVLKERNDALVTADRLKDAFVQNVSYELRSPLTNIIGFSDLLASPEIGVLNDRQRSYTDYIRASSVTLGVLIDNILDLATVDAGIAELAPEPQDIPALVEKARAGIAATFPEINGQQSINLAIDIAPNLPPFIADGTRIVQVLYNLLSSAARFSEPGGEVRLSIAARGQRMLFIVEDEGGMTDEVKAAIAERADLPSISGRQRGAGLGLAIVKAFVNLHGGTITVEKREPRGSRVVVNLPQDASSAASSAAE